MANTKTLNLRINESVKKQVEEVLSELGIPMSTAINIYLRQIILTGGIPFDIKLPQAPLGINVDYMSDDELHAKLEKGYNDAISGRVHEASEAFDAFQKKHLK